MKIIIVGASGRIGREVDNALAEKHEIVRVGARAGDVLCDYTDPSSVRSMYETVGGFDALVSVVGNDSAFKPFQDLKDEDYIYGFERKFLAQVRLLRTGEDFIRDNGSFVFTSGFLSHYPNPASIATGPFNAMVDTFVKNAAPLLPRGIRLNIVSPAPVVEPNQKRAGLVTAAETAKYYVEALEGDMSGAVLRAWGGLPVVND